MPFDQVLDYIMTKIPMTGDLNENATVLKFAFNIYGQSKTFNSYDFIDPEKLTQYMNNITLTCLKVLVDEKCDEIPV